MSVYVNPSAHNHAVPKRVRGRGADVARLGGREIVPEHDAVDAVQKHGGSVKPSRRGRRDRRPGETGAIGAVRLVHAFPRCGHVRGRRPSIRVVSPGDRRDSPVRPAAGNGRVVRIRSA